MFWCYVIHRTNSHVSDTLDWLLLASADDPQAEEQVLTEAEAMDDQPKPETQPDQATESKFLSYRKR